MRFEHMALNVTDPAAMAAWYAKHCAMTIVKALPAPTHTHFLADSAGQVCLEVYHNDAAPCLDLTTVAPLTLHLALQVTDAAAERDRLVAAGCDVLDNVAPGDGTLLVMLRDPFGLCLQLCQRAEPYPLPAPLS